MTARTSAGTQPPGFMVVMAMAKMRRLTECLMCRAPLPPSPPGGGRPRRFCSDRCRWAMHRQRRKHSGLIEVRYRRLVDTGRVRQEMREQAERLERAAGEVAFNLGEEDAATAARRLSGELGPIAGYTREGLPMLARARALLAAAVATDRAAGATWEEIAAALDVSADTAPRRFRSR